MTDHPPGLIPHDVSTAHFHAVLRHILIRHSEKHAIGYQTTTRAILDHSLDIGVDSEAFDNLNWEDIRDVIKKGRRLGEQKLVLLLSYLRAKEPELTKSLDTLGEAERIGEALFDFYIPPIYTFGTYDNAELMSRLNLHDIYFMMTKHGSSKIGFTASPKRMDRYLSLRKAEGLPFLLAHEFSLSPDGVDQRGTDEQRNLYSGICVPAPDVVVIQLRSVKFRNFRTLVLREHDKSAFQVVELHIPKNGIRTLQESKKKRALIGPYQAQRIEKDIKIRAQVTEYLDKIGIGI